ncbi:MAG TPA: helix-turn-helix transcriptional regulator [Candidatus Limnocylindrales bacterium]
MGEQPASLDEGGLGERLRALRTAKALSVAEITRRARISRTYYYRLERAPRGSNPSLDVVSRLAAALGVARAELLPGEDSHRSAALEALIASRRISPDEAHVLRKIAELTREDATTDDWVVLERAVRPMLSKKGRAAAGS